MFYIIYAGNVAPRPGFVHPSQYAEQNEVPPQYWDMRPGEKRKFYGLYTIIACSKR